jgi:hypothetical protein
MSDFKTRNQRINSKLNLDKISSKLKKINAESLGLLVSEFIHHIFIERNKSHSLNWCFANIKRVKIFLQIFHANQSNVEIYKEEIAKNLTEYSYKTIAKIIDDGLSKGYYILLHPDGDPGKDAKVKNIRPSEEMIVDFLNLSLEILNFVEQKKTP